MCIPAVLHYMWHCNILCSKHDIDMRMNEWNRHALFLSWNGRNRYLHSSLLKFWDFFHSWEKFSVFPLVPLCSTRVKTEFLTLVEEIPDLQEPINLFIYEWVSNSCLMPNEQFFSYIMAITSFILMKWWCPLKMALYHTNTLGWIFAAHWNNSLGRHVVTQTQPDSKLTRLCSYSLLLHA